MNQLNILHDLRLVPGDRIIINDIINQIKDDGIYAETNVEMAKKYGVSQRSISMTIANAKKLGYITSRMAKTGTGRRRVIELSK